MSETHKGRVRTELKRAAAVYAVETFIRPNMHVGLGSGSTAEIFVEDVGAARRAQ